MTWTSNGAPRDLDSVFAEHMRGVQTRLNAQCRKVQQRAVAGATPSLTVKDHDGSRSSAYERDMFMGLTSHNKLVW